MKKRIVNMLLLAGIGVMCLGGCGKAPEVSENGEVAHAKSNVEQAVEEVVAQGAEDQETSLAEPGGFYDDVIGTQENGIWICAEVPAVSGTVNQLTLQQCTVSTFPHVHPVIKQSRYVMAHLLSGSAYLHVLYAIQYSISEKPVSYGKGQRATLIPL